MNSSPSSNSLNSSLSSPASDLSDDSPTASRRRRSSVSPVYDKAHVDYHRSPVGHSGSATKHSRSPKFSDGDDASTDLRSIQSDMATMGSAADHFPLLPLAAKNLLLLEVSKTGNDHTVARLLSAGAHANARDQRVGSKGWRPLHYAVQGKHPKVVDLLLASGANADLLTDGASGKEMSPLDLAEQHATDASVEYELIRQSLLRHGATMRRRDKQLLLAVKIGPSFCPKSYSRRSVTGSRKAPKVTTFVFQDLEEAGANVNIKDRLGYAPLHYACRHKDKAWGLEAAGHLLALPRTAVNETDDVDERTPLHWAAKRGNKKLVLLLLEHGANVDQVDGELGWSALHFAAFGGHASVVRALISAGAKVSVLDKEQHNAAYWAERGSDPARTFALLAPLMAA